MTWNLNLKIDLQQKYKYIIVQNFMNIGNSKDYEFLCKHSSQTRLVEVEHRFQPGYIIMLHWKYCISSEENLKG